MRPNGRASIDPTQPSALAICERCGFRYNQIDLRWEFQWTGPRIQNLRHLVCESCWDYPQEQLRTVIYPPDPVPISNPRQEFFVPDDNPLSGIGASPNWLMQQYGCFIGNLTQGAGISAAFDSNQNKPSRMSASIFVSTTENYVGMNWAGNVSQYNMPTDLLPPIVTHTLASYTLVAPNDTGFMGSATTTYVVQGSSDNSTWTSLSSGTTAGTVGETIDGTCAGSDYQYHRVNFAGDGVRPINVAQVMFDVSDTGTITERT